jgi:uncharacterized repeat protein (TIGR01451 family)
MAAYGTLPLSFAVNEGQVGAEVRFLAQSGGRQLFLTDRGVIVVSMTPPESGSSARTGEAATGRAEGNYQVNKFGLLLKGSRLTIPAGVDQLPGKVNYFIGNHPEHWRANVGTYSRVLYSSVYPGVDVAYYGNQKQLEYDFVIAPYASFKQIRMSFEGARRLSLNPQGDLVVDTAAGAITLLKPLAFQEVEGQRRELPSHYVLKGRNEVAFSVSHRDERLPLVIDPILAYSSYLGGTQDDEANAIAVDSSGSAYITGQTSSTQFPVAGSLQAKAGAADVFVTKLNPSGSAIVYSTFLGGNGTDVGFGIALDSQGNAYITGETGSTDFPTANALHPTWSGSFDAFVAKLNSSGSALVYSTYLGGSSADFGNAIAVDQSGNAYVTGEADSRNFPTTNPLQANKLGSAIFKSSNSAGNWSAGDSGLTASSVASIVFDPTNASIIYAATENGIARSTNSGVSWTALTAQGLAAPVNRLVIDPTNTQILYAATSAGIYKSTDGGDHFTAMNSGLNLTFTRILAIDPVTPTTLYTVTFSNFVFKTIDGGSNWTASNITGVNTINNLLVDPNTPSIIYAATNRGVYKSANSGANWAASFPSTNSVNALAIDKTNNLLYAASVAGVFKSADSAVDWSNITGNLPTTPSQVVPDLTNTSVLYLSGSSLSVYKTIDGGSNWTLSNTGYPQSPINSLVVDPSNSTRLFIGTSSGAEAFLTKLNSTGTTQVYSTYLGGSLSDVGYGIAVDGSGNAYVTGTTGSADFPLANALQPAIGSFGDAFVAKVNPSGSALLYSTYLGGDGGEVGRAVAVDAGGNAFVCGLTSSSNFPTANALQANNAGGFSNDAFVTKLNSNGSALIYSTYLGGVSDDRCLAIAIDAAGSAYITGSTSSPDFPVLNSRQPKDQFSNDAFVSKLTPNGAAFVYSTFLGGSGTDSGQGIAADGSGNAYVVGFTASTNFPTSIPIQPDYGGSTDAFIVKLLPAPDLALTMSDSPDPVSLGGNLTYTITVNNKGEAGATGITLTDTLPAGATFVSAVPSQGTCNGTSTITCSLGSLNSNSNATVTVTIKPPAVTSINNAASVVANEVETSTSNNSASETTQVVFADLNIENSTGNDLVAPGTTVAYFVSVQNKSGSTATNVSVTEALPTGANFVSCSAVGGTCGGTGNNRTVTFPTLAVGASAGATILATADNALLEGTVLNATATVTSTVPDPDNSNNSSNASLTINPVVIKPKVNGKIVYSGEGRLKLINPDGTGLSNLTTGQTPQHPPAWSRDGSRVAFRTQSDPFGHPGVYEIFSVNSDGTGLTKLTSNAASDSPATWSPSGKRVAFVGKDSSIYTVSAAGVGGESKLVDNAAVINGLDWSPDGSKLAFVKNGEIYSIRIDGTGETKITTKPDPQISDSVPHWSPNGQKILFMRGSDAFLINADGTGETRLLNTQTSINPNWSPDGLKVVFEQYNELYTINVDASGLFQLTNDNNTTAKQEPAWQPLPTNNPQPPPPPGNKFTISGHVIVNAFALLQLTGTRTGIRAPDANGNYSFVNLPEGGNYTITPISTIKLFSPTNRVYSNLQGNQTNADFGDGGNIIYTISGIFSESSGAPIVGASVTLQGGFPNFRTTTTDANGRYEFSNLGLNNSYSVFPTSGSAYGYVPGARGFFLQSSGIANFVGYKSDPLTISGRVSDAANPGLGVAGAEVRLNLVTTTLTDANGNYSFTNVAPGADYTVTVNTPSFITIPNQVVFKALTRNQNAYFTRSSPLPTRTISGRLLGSQGGLDHFGVGLNGSVNATTVTASDGSYSFSNLPQGGSYVLTPLILGLGFGPAHISIPNLTNDSAENNFNAKGSSLGVFCDFDSPSYTVSEGAGSVTITVVRWGAAVEASVDYAVTNGSAEDRTDFTFASGTLHFAAGQISQTFSILLTDDLYVENPESLIITLGRASPGFLGEQSVATLNILDNDTSAPTTNPLDKADASFFVTQHYSDFLSRSPDPGGFAFWTGQITQCGTDQVCLRNKRIDVSNAFFYELEYQQTGSYVYRLYRAAFGNNQPFPNPIPDPNNPGEEKKVVSYQAFAQDRGRVVGGANLAQAQLDLANAFVERPEFIAKYPLFLEGPAFVDAILATIKNDLGVDLGAQRTALITLHDFGGRGAVIYRLADDNAQSNPINNRLFIDGEYNRAFVATQYFGYLRRDPDMGGYLFWLGQLNSAPLRDVPKQHAMVCSFFTSAEYQQRFSPVVTHTNSECQ